MTRSEIERWRDACKVTGQSFDREARGDATKLENIVALCDAALAMLPVVEAAEGWDRMLDEVAAGRPWNREQSQRLRNAVAAYQSSPHKIGGTE